MSRSWLADSHGAPYPQPTQPRWASQVSVRAIGIPASRGIDEIALALTADVYSRTYRGAKAWTFGATAEQVRSLGGLVLVPDRVGHPVTSDRIVALTPNTPSVQVLDDVLDRVSKEYGRVAAASAAYDLEYVPTKERTLKAGR